MTTPDTGDRNDDGLLDHSYDGIQEYDNPMPRWWLYIFYATIAFAALYFFNLFGLGTGKGRIASYESEMAAARAKYGASGAAAILALTDDQVLALSKDPRKVAAGKALFLNQCAPCHRPDAGGNIGPNLTDEYWLHGGRPSQILHTVNNGVLDKGMPAWGQMLKPDDVTAAVAYVLTLHDTHPANPKAPQGMKGEEAGEATSSAAASTPIATTPAGDPPGH